VLQGVRKIDAGHRAIVRAGQPVTVERYWDIDPARQRHDAEDDLLEELRTRLDESVRLHMRSDVPVGAFLSGGVDSSAVVSSIVRLGYPLKTFSIAFDEPEFDEGPHARAVAQACGTEHHELRVTPAALDVIEDLVWHLDEPFGDSSAIPTYLVSRLAAGHVKVVLTGDGGDELFGGYDKYLVEQREQRFDRLPRGLRRLLGAGGAQLPVGTPGRRYLMHMALDGADRYIDASTLFSRREQRGLLNHDIVARVEPSDFRVDARAALTRSAADPLTALQYADLRGYLPLDILVKVDRMTMAHSLEARPPLLDHPLAEFAMSLPSHQKVRGTTTKYLLKRALRDALPPGIADRPKQGFAVPLSYWFRGPWTGFAGDLLLSKTCRERGILNPAYVERLFALHRLGRNMDRELWMLASFEQWCRLFLDGRAEQPAPARVPSVSMVGAS
jgi:asparagine synthase (glutamine-hydrolysing)